MLSPYRVLDLTDEAGFLCGKIFSDLGADVIKIEPPGGDGARKVGPFPNGEKCPEKSLYWLSYNTGKRDITLDLEKPEGIWLFKRLVRRSDFVIETFPPGYLTSLGLGFDSLRAINPRLILISITPFGQTGPYKHYKGRDLVPMAMSGLMSLIGEPNEFPLRVSLPQAPMWAGMYATAGGMIAHYYRQRKGIGQQVDISLQAGLLWALANAPAFWATNRKVPQRAGSQITGRSVHDAKMRAIFQCKDGYINFIIYGGAAGKRSNQALVNWLAEEGLATDILLQKDWSRFNIATSTQEEIDELEKPTAVLFQRYTKAEFLEQGFRRGMLGYPVANAQDILADPHPRARRFWKTIDLPFLEKKVSFPGGFARFSEMEIGPSGPAPRIGEHNKEIYLGELGLSQAEFEAYKAAHVI